LNNEVLVSTFVDEILIALPHKVVQYGSAIVSSGNIIRTARLAMRFIVAIIEEYAWFNTDIKKRQLPVQQYT